MVLGEYVGFRGYTQIDSVPLLACYLATQKDIEPVANRVAEAGRMLNGLIGALQVDPE